jgi:hypothetical protein
MYVGVGREERGKGGQREIRERREGREGEVSGACVCPTSAGYFISGVDCIHSGGGMRRKINFVLPHTRC